MSGVRRALLWADGSCLVAFADAALALSSDGASFTLAEGVAAGGAPASFYAALALARHRPLVRAALFFRNTFTDVPYLPAGLLMEEDWAESCATWPAAAPIRVLRWSPGASAGALASDGAVRLASTDGLGTLTLAPHGQLFTVRWPARLRDVPEPRRCGDRAWYFLLDQSFSVRLCPERWRYPLSIALSVWRAQHSEEEAVHLPLLPPASEPWGLTELPEIDLQPTPSTGGT
eukprot:EG_transcript_26671